MCCFAYSNLLLGACFNFLLNCPIREVGMPILGLRAWLNTWQPTLEKWEWEQFALTYNKYLQPGGGGHHTGPHGSEQSHVGAKLCSFANVGWYLEKAMTPHSSTLAWKILWTEEPGRLQSMGSYRVGHDWSDLAAAAAAAAGWYLVPAVGCDCLVWIHSQASKKSKPIT